MSSFFLSRFRKFLLAAGPSYETLVRWFAVPPLKKVRVVSGLEHLPALGPAIFALNHIGPFADGMMFLGLVWKHTGQRLCYIARPDGFWNFFGDELVVAKTGLIPYHNGMKGKVIDEAIDRVQKGDFVGIFPEGIKNTTSTLLRGKSGVARLALATGVPIIPVGMKGPTGFYKSLWGCYQFFVQLPPSVEFHIGPPILTSKQANPSEEEINALTHRVMTAIGALTDKTYPY